MSQNIANTYYNKNQYNAQQAPAPNFSANGLPVNNGAAIQNNPIVKHAEKAEGNGVTQLLLGTAGFGAGLMIASDLINKPLRTKEYKDTFFNSIETTVDKFGDQPKVKGFTDLLHNKKVWFRTNVINKSEILRTLFDKPSIGGSTVQSQAAGSRGHLASRALEIMKKYKEQNPSYTGFDAILQKAEKESYKYYDEIIAEIKKVPASELTKTMTTKPKWGLGLIRNSSSLQELLNKARLIDNYKLAGTKLGQKASGYTMRAMECMSNGMFSGKGAILIQAFFLAQSLQEASKAEKGEKFSAFMASFMDLMAMMATIGIQMRVVNHLAGLKFIGMTPENHKKYQEAMEAVNKAAKAGNKTEYEAQKARIKKLKKAAKAKWYQKPVKWFGNLMSYGRLKETIKPLKAAGASAFFKKIPYGLKVGAGYAGRVALVMAVIIPFFSGIAKKISYTLFGKPTKTMAKEKAKENGTDEKTKQAQQPAAPINNPQPTKPNTTNIPPVQQVAQPQQPAVANNQGDLLNKMQQKYNPASPMGAQGINNNNNNNNNDDKRSAEEKAGITRSYVPNPVLGQE